MSDKYIIRNCPAFEQNSYKNRDWAIENACELIDDRCCIKQNCLLKQIVKKCRKSLEVSYCPIEQEILELLDIQEVE